MKKRSFNSGFTLIEILVVVVIIGILVAIVAPNVLDKAGDARVQKVGADFSAIETALKIYKLDNYSYPSTEQGIEALIDKPVIDPIPQNWKSSGYLDELPIDPWGRPYLYLYPAEYGTKELELLSLGADGVQGGENENADIGNWE